MLGLDEAIPDDRPYWRQRIEQYLNEYQAAVRDPANFIYPDRLPFRPPPPVNDLTIIRNLHGGNDGFGEEYLTYTNPSNGERVRLDVVVIDGPPHNTIRLVDRDELWGRIPPDRAGVLHYLYERGDAEPYDMRRDLYDAEYHNRARMEEQQEAERPGQPTLENFNRKIRTKFARTPNSPQLRVQYDFLLEQDHSPEVWMRSEKPYAVSFRLLMSHLNEEQQYDFLSHGMFSTKGSNGRSYTISVMEYAYNVLEGARGRVFCTANYSVPIFDTLLTQKLMIETDIDRFMDVANEGTNDRGFVRTTARDFRQRDHQMLEQRQMQALMTMPIGRIDITRMEVLPED